MTTPVRTPTATATPTAHIRVTAEDLEKANGNAHIARCIALADDPQHRLIGTARWLDARSIQSVRALGVERFEVPRSTRRGQPYSVVYDATREEYLCPCKAASFRNPCAHVGAVVYALWQMRRNLSEPGQAAHAAYLKWCDAHGF